MAEQTTKNQRPESEEIDLGQLFRLIGNGFRSIFNGLLGIFLYLKRNIFILSVLSVVGLAIGFGLSKIITKKQKIQVIVNPNWESKNYLYDMVDEVQANLEARDTAFFKGMGLQFTDFGGYEVSVEPVIGTSETDENDHIKYLELLQKFENTGMIADVLRAEILNKTALNHRITFVYRDRQMGPQLAKAVVDNLNSNNFYVELAKINKENAESRISENKGLISQIDQILEAYAGRMEQSEASPTEGRIVLSTEEELNVSEILELKSNLIRDTERMKVELLQQREPISVINFGKPQQVQRSFFGKKIVLIPTLLILLFLVIDFIRYLNRKALAMQKR